MLQEQRYDDAFKHFEEALANCDKLLAEGNSADKRITAMRLTIRFNLACCHEKFSQIGEASEMLKAILREEPSYTDAYMKLAYLA